MKFGLLLFLLFLSINVCLGQLEGKSKRAFHDTPNGQIHYKYGGNFSPVSNSSGPVCCTFLMFHGNPRSSDEFKELISELSYRFVGLKLPSMKLSFSFIAMDLFGEGFSDDAKIQDANGNNSYISMEQYAIYAMEIASRVLGEVKSDMSVRIGIQESLTVDDHAIRYIVPVGSLTGTAIATELSYKLKFRSGAIKGLENCKVMNTVVHDPMYYFSDTIVAGVRSYAALERKWQPQENGQHLMDIWNDPNYQPYKDIALQDRKSLDRLRAAKTQWQVILGYADYSSKFLLSRLTALSNNSYHNTAAFSESGRHFSASVPPLIILYGGVFLNDPINEKIFELQKMRGLISNAVKGGSFEQVIDGGNQALLSQNATIVADIIIKQTVG